jgi:hypothetical protein
MATTGDEIRVRPAEQAARKRSYYNFVPPDPDSVRRFDMINHDPGDEDRSER